MIWSFVFGVIAWLVLIPLGSTVFPLDMGGQINTSVSFYDIQSSLFNPENVLSKTSLGNEIKTITWLDSSQGSWAARVAFLNTYRRENKTKAIYQNEFQLHAATVQFSGDHWFVKGGKFFQKWGNGLLFNPSDVINSKKNPLMISQTLDREGKEQIDFSLIPNDVIALDLVLLAPETNAIDAPPLIPRLGLSSSWLSGHLFGVIEKNETPEWGGDLSCPLEIAPVIVYTEFRYKTAGKIPHYENGTSGVTYSREAAACYLLGFNWVIRDNMNLVVEYQRNPENLSHKEYMTLLHDFASNFSQPFSYTPALFGASKQYVASAFILNEVFQNMEFTFASIWNSSDGSMLIFPAMTYSPVQNWIVTSRWISGLGNNQSEFGNLVEKNSFQLSLDTYF